MTQEQLATMLNSKQSTVSCIESGEQEIAPYAAAIASIFGVSADYVLGLTDDPTVQPPEASSSREPFPRIMLNAALDALPWDVQTLAASYLFEQLAIFERFKMGQMEDGAE